MRDEHFEYVPLGENGVRDRSAIIVPGPQHPGRVQEGCDRTRPEEHLEQPQPGQANWLPGVKQPKGERHGPEVNKAVGARPHQAGPGQSQLQSRPARAGRQSVKHQRQEDHHEAGLLAINAEINNLGVQAEEANQDGEGRRVKAVPSCTFK